MSLSHTVLHTLQQNKLFSPDPRVIVAVSGGPDSLALLHILRRIQDQIPCQLHVATLDHGLRGDSGAEDVRFVTDIAQQWGLPVTAARIDARAFARQHHLSIEAAARRARYDFLADTARQVGAVDVAVAHHADDQAETILLHILRGSGSQGLQGMAYRAPLPYHPDLTVVRPLLNITRAEIEAYCRQHGLQPRHDASNRDTAYLRNAARWELLPMLRQYNPRITQSLAQLADIATVENDLMESRLQPIIAQYVTRSPGRILIPRAVFGGLHPALQRRLVIWAAAQVSNSPQDTGYVQVIAAVSIALTGSIGARARLKDHAFLRVDYDSLVIERDDAPPQDDPVILLAESDEIELHVPGTTVLGAKWLLQTDETPMNGFQARLAIPQNSSVHLRTRRTGDRFAPLGMDGHTQKLTDWMIDHKIPRRLRNHIPLLLVNNTICAVLYGVIWPISEYFAARSDNERTVYFAVRELS